MLTRSYVVYMAIALLGCAILGKAIYIQVVEGAYWREKAENLTTVYRDIEAVRGNIYSDDGSMLATSIPIYEVRMDLNADGLTDEVFNAEVDSLSIDLAGLFKNQSPLEWKRQLVSARQKGERYHLIKRNVKFQSDEGLARLPHFRTRTVQGWVNCAPAEQTRAPLSYAGRSDHWLRSRRDSPPWG